VYTSRSHKLAWVAVSCGAEAEEWVDACQACSLCMQHTSSGDCSRLGSKEGPLPALKGVYHTPSYWGAPVMSVAQVLGLPRSADLVRNVLQAVHWQCLLNVTFSLLVQCAWQRATAT
jgi:hypothetical protein